MNKEILVVFQCKIWFVYQATWFKAPLLSFSPENWRKFLILLIKNISFIFLGNGVSRKNASEIYWPLGNIVKEHHFMYLLYSA